MEPWENPNVNYWDNENCPVEYLRTSLIDLVFYVEGVELPYAAVYQLSDAELRQQIDWYEYLADK